MMYSKAAFLTYPHIYFCIDIFSSMTNISLFMSTLRKEEKKKIQSLKPITFWIFFLLLVIYLAYGFGFVSGEYIMVI